MVVKNSKCPINEDKEIKGRNETNKKQNEEPSGMHQFFERFEINPNLVPLKLCLFLLYGATSSLLPYLTIHMQSIGLTVQEIAMIYLALPLTTFLAPPLTGFLVDKFGKYKPIVLGSMVLNAIIHHSLLLIPHQELPGVIPDAYVVRHNVTGIVEVWWSPCPSRECPEEEELDMVLDRCIDHCLLQSNDVLETEMEGDEATADDLVFHLHRGSTFFVIDMHPDLAEPPEQLGIEMVQDENDTAIELTDRFDRSLLQAGGVNVTALEEEDLRCGGVVLATNVTYQLRLEALAANCMLQKCSFRLGGPDICPPDYKESDDKIFWIYFGLRFLGTVASTASVIIMDPIALTMIQKYGGDFGRERIFSSLGMAIFSPVTGILIDVISRKKEYTDYSPAFYTYDILLFLSAFTVLAMPLDSKLPADRLFHDLINIIKMPHVSLFILFLFVLGNFWGFIESFLFLYLKELGAPNYMLGITVTVGTLSSMPFLYGADKITKKIGHVNIIVIAFFSHAARLVGYSFIESAWWCFPFEAMESLSVHLMWVAAATYCAILAPKSLLASLIGILGMAHFSIGRGSGSFVGGFLIENFGTREAFRYMGLMAVAGGILYAVLHLSWLRKFQEQSPFEKDDDEMDPETEKMKSDEGTNTPQHKSAERLSLVIEYNQIGSVASLGREPREIGSPLRTRSTRRASYNIGSASKVDMLRSTIEINNAKLSNPQLRLSHHTLTRNASVYLKISKETLDDKTGSIPRLSQRSNIQITGSDHERVNKRDSIDSIPEVIEEIDEKPPKAIK